MNPSRIKLAALTVGTALAVAVSGCDLQENADFDNGRELFVAQCGTCHQLSEAGTTARIGPDLDAAFAAAREAGMDDDTIEGVLESQIANPRLPSGPDPESDPTYMPAELVTGDDARDVSYYVAQVAGVPGIMPPEAPGGPGGQVFANNGCGACHAYAAAESNGQVGPNLDDVLAGQTAEQITQSIVDPEAEPSPGFGAGIMPQDYGDQIPPEDLKLLVEFLMGGGSGGNDAGPSNAGPSNGGSAKAGKQPGEAGNKKKSDASFGG